MDKTFFLCHFDYMKEKQKIYRYTLRLNEDMHKMLSKRAALNNRTMHSEIIEILREELKNPSSLIREIQDKYVVITADELLKRLENSNWMAVRGVIEKCIEIFREETNEK